ncbi:MAG TPA: amino acid adenylation domain-containing protein, partial [Candidatus Angelobacter sp.]|nr:amino acid adenylation domain-containing protein [Candidatus Angelobacter sp.]
MDPAYPLERSRFLLSDSEAKIILYSEDTELTQLPGVTPVNIGEAMRAGSIADVGVPLDSGTLAYVMYTSGSTGKPKGVQVTHRSVVNLLCSMREAPGITQDDTLLAVTTLSFDIAGLELFLPLCVGARLVLAKRETASDGERLLKKLQTCGATILQGTPATWRLLLEAGWRGNPKLKMICGGEALDRDLANQLLQTGGPLWNMYGPTESTIWSSTLLVKPGSDPVSIGSPINNTQIYVLNSHNDPQPVGVAGELLIAGDGLARGYLNRSELTLEKFVANPFRPGTRMYKTGDLVRWLADGNIRYLGRIDTQVKIRGFRVELGEIEARLAEHPGVRETVVVVDEDAYGGKRLVAYYTTTASEEGTTAEGLRVHLAGTLPQYMLPAVFVELPRFPLTANGKVDRKALPAPEAGARSTRDYEPPQGRMENLIAEIWVAVLKLNRVGRNDNFFELGGHSLLVVSVISRIRQSLGLEVSISDLFAHPGLDDFARHLENAAQSKLPPIMRVQRTELLPLSFAQQRLWFLSRMEAGSKAYHIMLGVRLRGRLDGTALRRALDQIVTRHEALRTTFIIAEGEPQQRIAPADQERFQLLEVDLHQQRNTQGNLERTIAEEAGAGFDLQAGPLIRGRLIRTGEEEHGLLINMHHIVSDEWSLGVFVRELSALYSAYVRGGEARLPELTIQYADYAAWQRKRMEGEVLQAQAEYWKKNLEGVPDLLELPSDYVRPAKQDYAGAAVQWTLNEKLTCGLKELSRRHGTTLFMTLLAGWALLLERLSGQQDLVIGTPVANRGLAEIENLIGFFVNMLALRLDVSGRPTVRAMLERVKKEALDGQQHQDMPFEQVVELLQPVRSLAHSPLFQVSFTWLANSEAGLKLPGLDAEPLELSPHLVSRFDIALLLQETRGRIEGGVE